MTGTCPGHDGPAQRPALAAAAVIKAPSRFSESRPGRNRTTLFGRRSAEPDRYRSVPSARTDEQLLMPRHRHRAARGPRRLRAAAPDPPSPDRRGGRRRAVPVAALHNLSNLPRRRRSGVSLSQTLNDSDSPAE